MRSGSSFALKRESSCPAIGELRIPSHRETAALHHQYMEALPIAAAVVELVGGQLSILSFNLPFSLLDGKGCDGSQGPLLDRCGFAGTMAEFLESGDTLRDIEWSDGGPIVGRTYQVRLARVVSPGVERPRCLMTLLDRTAERQAEQGLRREMFNDSLTGLPNRAGFGEVVEKALGCGLDQAVLIVDLARFSRINESIGALSGDELLITVARRLIQALRAGDVIARTGGNEFGLLVHLTDGPGDALHVAQRINEALTAPCRLSDLEIRIDCAVGCALAEPDCDAEELIRRAQFALKRAKGSGKTEVYQSTAFNQARRRFSLETQLRRALEANRLQLAFQPVVNLQTGVIDGFETLARWYEGNFEISPTEFIPVAEESGLIVPLGRWALDQALQTLARWDRAEGAPLAIHLAVNISAIQIARDDVATAVADALTASGIEGRRLTLELTESAIIADPDRATRTMNALKALGASLAMDDFGTGYSNLAFLQRLPIDILKIDRSFVTTMLGDRDKVAIVRAILSLARALGIETTAEGIETVQLAQTLGALGCTRGQGFFYAKPLDPDAALAFWRAHRTPATTSSTIVPTRS